jgi:hypothetical protein
MCAATVGAFIEESYTTAGAPAIGGRDSALPWSLSHDTRNKIQLLDPAIALVKMCGRC